MKTVDIRMAVTEDAPRISDLLHQLGYPVNPEKVRLRMQSLLPDKDKTIRVAESETGTIIGCVQVTMGTRLAEGRYAEITALVVDERWRGQGVGKRLLEAAKAWLKTVGEPETLRVRCNVRRTEAHRFYENCGFREVKSQKVFDTLTNEEL